ncbi:hypothetical protein [Methylocystis heyeri]|uniref:Uncharacterized protein n=1 Tax=Methylocystis heyeri TaxID=391905 RepID=A0A6B8KCL7_9HYPH|nr:hypothetical protein [Methylocystis heyeri]QGM44765.1 hypothetical protein H2LOC_003150 [Methylocystis heyeri]
MLFRRVRRDNVATRAIRRFGEPGKFKILVFGGNAAKGPPIASNCVGAADQWIKSEKISEHVPKKREAAFGKEQLRQ